MTILLDTDVLIDCLRGTVAAQDWLRSHASDAFDVPGIVAMELVVGSRNQDDLQHAQAFLSSFNILWPDAADFALAYDLLIAHRLATALSIPDCLIAAMALQRSARLFTFNTRHFRAIPTIDLQEPYLRA